MDESQSDPPAPFAESPLPPHYPCPNCGQPVEPSDREAVMQCPHCNTQFFPPTPTDSENAGDETSRADSDDEAELSELRIRQLVTLRRSAYRTRTYYIVGVVASGLLFVLLVKFVVQSVMLSHHWAFRDSAASLFAIGALFGVFKFRQFVAKTQREIDEALAERERQEAEAAKVEPDLSSLSDGSQRARNLEQMQDGE